MRQTHTRMFGSARPEYRLSGQCHDLRKPSRTAAGLQAVAQQRLPVLSARRPDHRTGRGRKQRPSRSSLPTRGSASPPRNWSASSSRFTAWTSATGAGSGASASGWPWSVKSSPCTAARFASKASRVKGAASSSASRSPARPRQPTRRPPCPDKIMNPAKLLRRHPWLVAHRPVVSGNRLMGGLFSGDLRSQPLP